MKMSQAMASPIDIMELAGSVLGVQTPFILIDSVKHALHTLRFTYWIEIKIKNNPTMHCSVDVLIKLTHFQ